jgi:hypothetical protein
MMTLAIFFSYALQFYVPLEILWPLIAERIPGSRYALLINYGFRMLLVLFTCEFLPSVAPLYR